MPWPVDTLLKRPWITLILPFNGSSGSSVLPSFISAPEPSAVQWSSFTPLPMNRTAKRFGKLPGIVESAKAGSDSSHGNAMATPAPRRIVRREMRSASLFVLIGIRLTFLFRKIRASFVHELRAGDNRLHQGREAIAICSQRSSHALHGEIIGEQKGPSKRIG